MKAGHASAARVLLRGLAVRPRGAGRPLMSTPFEKTDHAAARPVDAQFQRRYVRLVTNIAANAVQIGPELTCAEICQ